MKNLFKEYAFGAVGALIVGVAVLWSGFGRPACPTVKGAPGAVPGEVRASSIILVDKDGKDRLRLYVDGNTTKIATGGRTLDVGALARRLGDRE